MTTVITRIGNSKGVIIPSSLLKSLSLGEKDRVALSLDGNRLILEKKEPFTGPFTGPFAGLAVSSPVWGGDSDAVSEAEIIRSSRNNKETRKW